MNRSLVTSFLFHSSSANQWFIKETLKRLNTEQNTRTCCDAAGLKFPMAAHSQAFYCSYMTANFYLLIKKKKHGVLLPASGIAACCRRCFSK